VLGCVRREQYSQQTFSSNINWRGEHCNIYLKTQVQYWIDSLTIHSLSELTSQGGKS
jgi:hypothetical protein